MLTKSITQRASGFRFAVSVDSSAYFTVLALSKPEIDTTPTYYYAGSAFSYLAAMISSNSALQYVSYPTQVKMATVELHL